MLLGLIDPHPAICLWLVPHVLAILSPVLIGLLCVNRWQFSIRHCLCVFAIVAVLLGMTEPGWSILLRHPNPGQVFLAVLEGTYLSSTVLACISALGTWLFVKCWRASRHVSDEKAILPDE